MWAVPRDLYSSKTASEITSETYWVGDASEIQLFVRGTGSLTSVEKSIAEGRQVAIPEASWSHLTFTNSTGTHIPIAPYPGWLRCLRSLTTEVTLTVFNRPW